MNSSGFDALHRKARQHPYGSDCENKYIAKDTIFVVQAQLLPQLAEELAHYFEINCSFSQRDHRVATHILVKTDQVKNYAIGWACVRLIF